MGIALVDRCDVVAIGLLLLLVLFDYARRPVPLDVSVATLLVDVASDAPSFGEGQLLSRLSSTLA